MTRRQAGDDPTGRTPFLMRVTTSMLLLGLALMGCTVKQGNGPEPATNGAVADDRAPEASRSASGSDCSAVEQGCVERCNAAAPDEASRQPCYTRCVKEVDACAGR